VTATGEIPAVAHLVELHKKTFRDRLTEIADARLAAATLIRAARSPAS